MILSLENISFKYNDKPILDKVNFIVNEKDKWGIVGLNGCGKTTLLKIIAQQEKPDSGQFTYLNKFKLSYCPQESKFNEELSIYETVLRNIDGKVEEFKIKSVLSKFSLEQYDEKVKYLSGGQKKRIALAIALIQEADIYLLDEPTNHLDQDMIVWLEKYLIKSSKALIIVTHDRYFLNRITDHIVEIDEGKLYTYQGNYTYYLEQKEIRYAQMQAIEAKRQNFLHNEIKWIHASAQARSTKQKARIQHYNEIASIQAPQETETLHLSSVSSRIGGKVIDIKNISKSYDGKTLFNNFSYNILRNDRIGIVGDNGVGKTTLIKIIAGLLKPDSGIVEIGETIKIGYFAQHNDILDSNTRVIDYLCQFGEIVYDSQGEQITASKMLERFLFFKEEQYKPIEKCSGGEKRRLYLCSILMQAPNILLLDEPTNDLDIQTLVILEDYIEHFKGAVLAISHDRYFLDKIAQHLFVVENNNVNDLLCSYSQYLEMRSGESNEIAKEKKSKEKTIENKLTFNEKKELEQIDKRLPLLEKEIKELEIRLGNVTEYKDIKEISDRLDILRQESNDISERWLILAEKQ